MYPRKSRLSRTRDIESVFQKGKAFRTRFFLIKALKTPLFYPRFAVVVSTKVSKKAVERNRLRRRLREIARKQTPARLSYDLVFVGYASGLRATFQDLLGEYLKILRTFRD